MAHTQGSFILTARTYEKAHIFAGDERLRLLQTTLFQTASEMDLLLEAWAVFPNHYHIVARSESGAFDIPGFAKKLHGRTSVAANRLDGVQGRKVWFNFRDTSLTNSVAYLSRLHYVHANAVRHGLVGAAREYPYCSAHWFESHAEEAWIRTVYSFKIDRIDIYDDSL